MAEAGISVGLDQFNCPVCLELLNEPVTIHCGHSFCKVCINLCWDQEEVKGMYNCPECRYSFTPRPVLHRNNMLAEVVEKLKKAGLQAPSSSHGYAGRGDVECDSCIGRKQKAVTSCLVCQASYCEDHLKTHHESPAFKKHKLVEACAALQEKICSQHDKLIEITVTAEAERNKKQETELIRAQEKSERVLKQLEQEIADLQRRVTELEQLSHTHDHIHFLQSFPSLCVSPGCDDSPSFTLSPHLSLDGVKKPLSDLKKTVKETATSGWIDGSSEPKRYEDFLQYFSDLTLDPNTAHRELVLSEKNRAVRRSERPQRYSVHPERFGSWSQVLCKESVCGRCYWEVEWSGDVDISVSYIGIRKKGLGFKSGFGYNSKSWSLECSPFSVFFRHNDTEIKIRGRASSRIGVYVDHSAGTLSFYSVSDTMRLLHRVHTTFTQPLYAGFNLSNIGSTVRLCDVK